MPNAAIQTEYFAMRGGLDQVSPALTIPPGMVIDSLNFEPSIYGGYRRMAGYERFDGRTSPSSANYYVMACTITVAGSVVVGNTITGLSSGASSVVISVTSTSELIVTRLTGTYTAGETLQVGGVSKGTFTSNTLNGASTALLHATYTGLAADSYRSLITTVPGSGPVRGVKYYNGDVYAFRDNVGATACVMHKATTSGWTAITFGREIQFTGAVGEIFEGNTVTGATSGASAVVKRALLRTGTWTASGVGTLVFDSVTAGPFQNGENLQVGGITKAVANGADTAITLQPGGKFVIENGNFSGGNSTYRMYGCDGVNYMFEFDGTRLVPIRTGITPDAPQYMTIWQNMLVAALQSSVQFSGTGSPYSWTALTGAAEIALGDTCTGLLKQTGNQTIGALAVFTKGRTFMLYGTSTADLQLVVHAPEVGSYAYTQQNIGMAYYLDVRGLVQINTTQAFGNFEMASISRAVQPFLDSKRGLAVSSCIVRNSNQYRVFFNDGTGLFVYITQQPNQANDQPNTGAAIMPFQLSSTMYLNTVDSAIDSSGIERIFASGSDGYVYELEKGTSFDGSDINAYLFMSFNSNRTPRNRKRYIRTILQATCTGIAQVNVGYDLSYADGESDSGLRQLTTLLSTGAYWDSNSFTWDAFTWDSPISQEYKVDTPGNGRNIGMIIYGQSDIDGPYIISSAILNYTINRLER